MTSASNPSDDSLTLEEKLRKVSDKIERLGGKDESSEKLTKLRGRQQKLQAKLEDRAD